MNPNHQMLRLESTVCEDAGVVQADQELHGQNLAAIDIGTSSVHLAIAKPTLGGRPEILAQHKVPVRLGSGAKDMKRLDPSAVLRTIDALRDFRGLADAYEAEVHAVATSAVREAHDNSAFLEQACEEAGITVEVIAGTEEARLIHLGVLGALPIAGQRHLVIDIGGGSTELVVGEGRNPEILRSLKLGHVRLTDRFFTGVIDTDAVNSCRTFIRSFLARAAVTVREADVDVVAGASGTFETVAKLAAKHGNSGADITAESVAKVVEHITQVKLADRDAVIEGVDEHRQDTILAGAILVDSLMHTLDFDRFVVSPDALREGLVLDRLNRRETSHDNLRHLDSIRAHSVDAAAIRYGENLVHARQSTDIALRIFDATTEIHQFGEPERDVLEAGAMLHNIGRFIGHGAHHRHSYYVIRNTEHLAGFNEHERELIAQVARYHRKSAPKMTHSPYAALNDRDRSIVSTLAGMLRIGIALDRTYRNVAADVSVRCRRDGIEVVVFGDDLDLELFSANERKGLLADALGIPIVIAGSPADVPVPQP